ncbi:YcjF family protein [Sorangium sp. So ce1182]|uniref:YcjF family protein n=1 Tax=Sorangium sp. So ce1182 TaxID=3133334 RepID=UPI003F62820E
MASETVQTTETKQPGKQEFKQEAKTETDEGVRYERHEYRSEVDPDPFATGARTGRAEAIIQRNVMWSLGAGVLPVPFFDVLAISGVQAKMLKELSDLYGVPFTSSIAKKIVYSLLSGLGSVGVGSAIGASLAKMLPGLGTTLGVVSVPIFAGAFTHALGRIFLMHFESGGTFLDFDPHAMRAYFRQEFEKAKVVVDRMRKEEGKGTGTWNA